MAIHEGETVTIRAEFEQVVPSPVRFQVIVGGQTTDPVDMDHLGDGVYSAEFAVSASGRHQVYVVSATPVSILESTFTARDNPLL